MDLSDMFTVTPMNQQIELSAGEIYNGKIIVANPAMATSDFHFSVTASSYSVVGEDYDVDFLSKTKYSMITDWITIKNPHGVLKPNEVTEVEFTITVPEDAPSGGQYAVIKVSSDDNTAAQQEVTIGNIFEMASIVYAKISGETIEKGEILENNVPGFVTKTPIIVNALVSNDGNVHEPAYVSVSVKSVFSDEMIYPKEKDEGVLRETIMPETKRLLTREIDNISQLGIFEITQTVDYLGETSTTKKTVVVCPIWFMILVSVTVMAIIAVIVKGIHSRRKKRVVF